MVGLVLWITEPTGTGFSLTALRGPGDPGPPLPSVASASITGVNVLLLLVILGS